MWIVYRKADKKVVATSAASQVRRAKDDVLSEVVASLVEGGPEDEFDAFHLDDPAQALDMVLGQPRQLTVKEVSGKMQVVEQVIERGRLQLTVEGADQHPVDQIPVLAADGKAVATVHVRKARQDGQELSRVKDNDTLWLRTTGGRLLGPGGAPLRTLKLDKGQASFQLLATSEPRLVTVQVLCANPDFAGAELLVEFA